MTTEGCRPWRESLGAYALGHLPTDERTALEAHVDGCAACDAELRELRPVAEALPAADPAHLGARPAPPADLGERVAARIRAEHSSRVRRRWKIAVAGVAAAAVLVATTLTVSAVLREDRPDYEVFRFPVLPAGVEAKAYLYPPKEGTPGVEVWLEVDGLEPGARYAVWVERRSTGERVGCGTFRAVDGAAHIVLPSEVDRGDTGAVGVSTAEGEFVMIAPVT
ncbi:MAG: zf-HC2 domain-containing protein [Actinomycetota bacterium]